MDIVLLAGVSSLSAYGTLHFYRKSKDLYKDRQMYKNADILSPSLLLQRAQQERTVGGEYRTNVFLTGVVDTDRPYRSKLNNNPLVISKHYRKLIYSNDDSFFQTSKQAVQAKKLLPKDCVTYMAPIFTLSDYEGPTIQKAVLKRNMHVEAPDSLDLISYVEHRDELGFGKQILIFFGRVLNVFAVLFSNDQDSFIRGFKVGEKEIEYGVAVNSIILAFGEAVVDSNRNIRMDKPLFLLKDKDAIFTTNTQHLINSCTGAVLLGSVTFALSLWLISRLRARALAHKERQRQLQRDQMNGMKEIHIDGVECIICYAARRSIIVKPCKHVCMCKSCYDKLPTKECPICKQNIIDVVEIFFA